MTTKQTAIDNHLKALDLYHVEPPWGNLQDLVQLIPIFLEKGGEVRDATELVEWTDQDPTPMQAEYGSRLAWIGSYMQGMAQLIRINVVTDYKSLASEKVLVYPAHLDIALCYLLDLDTNAPTLGPRGVPTTNNWEVF